MIKYYLDLIEGTKTLYLEVQRGFYVCENKLAMFKNGSLSWDVVFSRGVVHQEYVVYQGLLLSQGNLQSVHLQKALTVL